MVVFRGKDCFDKFGALKSTTLFLLLFQSTDASLKNFNRDPKSFFLVRWG